MTFATLVKGIWQFVDINMLILDPFLLKMYFRLILCSFLFKDCQMGT